MCNPRRVQIRATCQLAEAWAQEIARSVALTARVCGEARVRQPLGAVLGVPALRALESRLASTPGWMPVDGGFRHNVDGGYVIYLTDDRVLEIVATLEDVVQAEGQASLTVQGKLEGEVQAEGEGMYYEDGYGGRTKEVGEKQAHDDAQQKLEGQKRKKLDEARQSLEAGHADRVQQEARTHAQEKLEQEQARRTAELNQQARRRLETIGLRCRQAFHQVLALSYRDAIMAYAHRHAADNIHCDESGDSIEIEFTVQR